MAKCVDNASNLSSLPGHINSRLPVDDVELSLELKDGSLGNSMRTLFHFRN